MSKRSGKKQKTAPKEPAGTVTLASILEEFRSQEPVRLEQRQNRDEQEQRADAVIQELKRTLGEAPEGVSVPGPAEDTTPPQAEPDAACAEPEELPAGVEEPVAEVSGPEPLPGSDEAEADGAEAPAEEAEPETVDAPIETGFEAFSAEPEAGAAAEEEPEAEAPAQPEKEQPEEAAADDLTGEDTAEETAEEPPAKPAGNSEKEERRRRREAVRATRAEEREILAEDRAVRIEEFRRKREAEREERRSEKQKRVQTAEEEQKNRPELTVEEAEKQYASGIYSLRRRLTPAFLITLLMAVLTFLNGASFLPEAFRSGNIPVMLLLVMQLMVILLGADVLFAGLRQVIRLKPGVETMVLAANIAAAADAAVILSGMDKGGAQPYCAAASAVLAFCLWGTYCRRCGFRDTIRAVRLASVPTVVTLEDKPGTGKLLNKHLGSSRGFLLKSTAPDLAERFFGRVIPGYVVLVILMSVVAAYFSDGSVVLHSAACLTCAAATLPAALVFAKPFSDASKRLIRNGAALAGWKGAQEMQEAGSLVVRDLDVFPENTIALSGMKVLPGATPDKLVAYTGSVMLATGSGLRRVFGELMRQYAAPLYQVDEFDCGTEGGICAFIQKEQVLVGSSAYMNLMGLRIPSGMEVAGAIYTAIDHELCGLFVVQYAPLEAVQSSLYLLETGKLKPLFAIRDFNIYPSMMTQKFRLTEGSVTFRPVEERYELSEEQESRKLPSALLSREGLWHYLETARSGRRLVRTVSRALVMTAVGSVLGVLIGFISFARGAYAAVQPWKLLTAMLLWAFATLMIAESADGD